MLSLLVIWSHHGSDKGLKSSEQIKEHLYTQGIVVKLVVATSRDRSASLAISGSKKKQLDFFFFMVTYGVVDTTYSWHSSWGPLFLALFCGETETPVYVFTECTT